MDENQNETSKDKYEELAEWIVARTDHWRDHRKQNYDDKWEEYYNLWRGIWSADSKTRESERAKLISPATQQAIESHVSEIEEACFGRGLFFDIEADMQQPQAAQEVELLKNNLAQDFKRDRIRKAVGDCLLNAGIFGTGIGEIVVEETTFMEPASQPMPGSNQMAVGVMEKPRVSVKLKPIQPNNFLIEPTAVTVEQALGCAVEEFVSRHSIVQGIEDGVYLDVDIEPDTQDDSLSPTFEDTEQNPDKVKVLRYYGLVPKRLLAAATEEIEELFEEEEVGEASNSDYEGLVEAIVVIVNDGKVIKVEESPYMMKDRPIVTFQDDIVPNSFWGRGIAEKGYNSQKGLDTELRARIDNLALVSVPMIAMDASRLPRGAKFQVKPGGSILTNGNPKEILHPFTFGQLDQNSYQQAREFERMLLMATGTTDASSVPAAINGEATAAGMSMALGALIKRQKRTLVNFQESFLIPFVEKAAWRYMQFDPDRYPVKNYRFVPVASMGIMAREYEQAQLVGLLQTMGPDDPIKKLILRSYIDNSSIHNRQQLLAAMDQASQPNPQAQQMQQVAMQMDMTAKQADVQEKQARAQKTMAEAKKVMTETQFIPVKAQADVIAATTNNLADDPADKAFEQRLALTDRILKEREIKTKEQIVEKQMRSDIPDE